MKEEDTENEIKSLRNVFLAEGYPTRTTQTSFAERQIQGKEANKQTKLDIDSSLHKGLSERITQNHHKHDIRVAFPSNPMLQNALTQVKQSKHQMEDQQ